MKKIIALFLTALLLALTLISCDDSGKLDFTGLNNDELFGTLSAISVNPEDYIGREVKISANVSVIYSFGQNRVLSNVLIALDPTNCCDAYYEIRTQDGKYPGIGAEATVNGVFADGYIDVSELITDNETPAPDIDTLSMSPDEVTSFITDYADHHLTSDERNKTICIVGHYTMVEGYRYLLGLTNEGKPTWEIELGEIADGIALPVQNGNYINPVYIYGTLSYYTEDTNTYACINVSSAQKVVAVMD